MDDIPRRLAASLLKPKCVLRPLGYSLISQFDTEITTSDYLMNLTTLFEVNIVLRVMRVLRGDRGILGDPPRGQTGNLLIKS